MKKYNIGIDMGTSSVKLILIDQRGNLINQSSVEYEVDQPGEGWKEIHPDVWFQATKTGLKTLLANVDSSLVEGIGITGQMHTVVCLDEEGNSVRPALMWNDVRTRDLIDGLKAKIEKMPSISHISHIISTGSPAANLFWIKEREPANFSRIRHFLIGPDYLVYRLTGTIGTDYCEASTSSLYDLERDEWSEEIRNLIGLSPSIYPAIRGSGEIAGTVKPELREEFGFTEKTKVIVGTGDNPAAALSTGCLTQKYPVLSLGTSGVLMIPRKKADFSRKGKNIKFSIEGKEIMTLVQGVAQSAGSSIDWWMKKILNVENLGEEMKQVKIGESSSLMFYPHLTGDKTIYGDPYLRGAFLGLGTETKREEMIGAVLEGICFAVKEIMDEMRIEEPVLSLKVTGGGAKNAMWMQMMADILEVSIEQLDGNTGAGLGIALLAGQSCGNIENLDQVSDSILSIKQVFVPNQEKILFYKEKYKKYRKIYRAIKEID